MKKSRSNCFASRSRSSTFGLLLAIIAFSTAPASAVTTSSGSPATLTFTDACKITAGLNSNRTLINNSANLSLVFASTLATGGWTDTVPPDASINETNPNQIILTLPVDGPKSCARLVVHS